MNIFEMAAKLKFRFPYKGQVTTEDLFDLKVEELDKVFKALMKEKKQSEEESLLAKKTNEDIILDAKIEIVKYIVSMKQAQKEAQTLAKEEKERKQKIMAIIAEKKDEALKNMSIEDLEKLL